MAHPRAGDRALRLGASGRGAVRTGADVGQKMTAAAGWCDGQVLEEPRWVGNQSTLQGGILHARSGPSSRLAQRNGRSEGGARAVSVGGYPQSKGKSSADLLKELPCGAAVVALEKVAIVTVKKSQGEKRRKHHRRRSQQ